MKTKVDVPPSRVVIENVRPSIDEGRFPIKRTVGEQVRVTADVFADGHDLIGAIVCFRRASESVWSEIRMEHLGNDRWAGKFTVESMEPYFYTVQGWIDHFGSWRRDLKKKFDAAQDIGVDLLAGAQLIDDAAARAGDDAPALRSWADAIRTESDSPERRTRAALDDQLADLMRRHPDRSMAAIYPKELPVAVARERARFSSWYEMFPRSCTDDAQRHGRFADCENRLDYVASMGFDVLYLPPIHPIGHTNRKGRNNAPSATPGEPGSPWAIGAPEGGHKAIHPELGVVEDLKRLREKAEQLGIELALDLAVQATPDHPLVAEHPEWFKHRPDGSIQYAENPPKKYQDIYPFDFECADWKRLWKHFHGVVLFWIEQGIRIFRVDNPHTKSFAFWEWLIAEVRKQYPDVIFLAEAFTRPKVMYRLAKLGFDQSYTYFTWRNTKHELTEYVTELARGEVSDFYRPNFWPNTPDILPEYLQYGGRPAFAARLILAATLSSNYGIYGPAFELLENRPVAEGREEYLDSEKYEIRAWKLDRPDSLRDLIARVNEIRREHSALHYNHDIRFHHVDNDQMIAYSKGNPETGNVILTIVNLDPYHVHTGWLTLPLEELGIAPNKTYQAHDLLGNARYFWNGERNFIRLDPQVMPAHIFALRRKVRTEHDFDYYL